MTHVRFWHVARSKFQLLSEPFLLHILTYLSKEAKDFISNAASEQITKSYKK